MSIWNWRATAKAARMASIRSKFVINSPLTPENLRDMTEKRANKLDMASNSYTDANMFRWVGAGVVSGAGIIASTADIFDSIYPGMAAFFVCLIGAFFPTHNALSRQYNAYKTAFADASTRHVLSEADKEAFVTTYTRRLTELDNTTLYHVEKKSRFVYHFDKFI